MTTVTIRGLRDRGGDIVDVSELLRLRRNLPAVDPAALRRDIDGVTSPTL